MTAWRYLVFGSVGSILVGCLMGRSGGELEVTRAPVPGMVYEENATKAELMRASASAHPARARRMGTDPYDIYAYGRECEAAVGRVPVFSCLSGAVIPITVGDSVVPAGAHVGRMTCDRPVQLGLGSDGQCVPYARVGRFAGMDQMGQVDPDVEWTFICRRYAIRTDPEYAKFEDVAIIGFRKSSGSTCFFQTLSSSKGLPDGIRATRVPPPTEKMEDTPPGEIPAADFWLSPEQTASIECYRCHDSDPWIHTPYIDQVRSGNGDKPLVPEGATINDTLRYKFVGSQYFSDWPAPAHFEPLNNRCLGCHRIGNFASSRGFAEYAIGVSVPNVSDRYRAFPRSHWMPPGEAAGMEEGEWNEFYLDSARQIISCGQNPSQVACRLRPTNP